MAFSEIEIQRYKKILDAFLKRRRPPAHLRDQVDVGFRLKGQSLEIFEVRPSWRTPGPMIEQPVAKTTYVKTRKVWKVYWQRADMKWHGYGPAPEVKKLEEFISLVEKDEYHCFWG